MCVKSRQTEKLGVKKSHLIFIIIQKGTHYFKKAFCAYGTLKCKYKYFDFFSLGETFVAKVMGSDHGDR